jgi:hypothetical protein
MDPVRLAPAAGILPCFDHAATDDAGSARSVRSMIFCNLSTLAAVRARKRLAFRVQPALLWCGHACFLSIERRSGNAPDGDLRYASCPAYAHRCGGTLNDQGGLADRVGGTLPRSSESVAAGEGEPYPDLTSSLSGIIGAARHLHDRRSDLNLYIRH